MRSSMLSRATPAALLCFAIVSLIIYSSQSLPTENKRVLLVRDSAQLAAIEEAATLSLDLPRQSAADQLTPATANQTGSPSRTTTTSSTGSKQMSLASLTLSQREPASESNSVNASRQASEQTTTAIWNETVQLARHKPSWLNVSSRFKITGATIEEVVYMMPAEYMLRQAFDSPVLLKTRLGILEGVRSIKFNKHLYTFLSVPYALPPVDELRFRAPQMVEKWDGILQATKWPPFCVQPSMTLASKSSPVHPLSQLMSEDCLYLNIWTPSLKLNRVRRRPVMVWLHGGAFQYGGISVDENDGSALALAGDVVVVTLNYRISAFGFLNANNRVNGPNNVGLLDQRLALEWVQQNIKQFGGDPQQVTLFGESAGGHSVGLHMISPQSQALFQRVIMQSGVPTSFLRSYDVNSDNNVGATTSESVSSVMMAKRLKCYAGGEQTTTSTLVGTTMGEETTMSTDETTTINNEEPISDNNEDQPILSDETLDCMRKKSSLEILKAMGAPGNAGFFPTGNDAKGFFPNGPIMDSFDGENLKIGPQKDYLIGVNVDEGTFMLNHGLSSLFPAKEPPKVNNIEDLKTSLQQEIERMAKEAAISTATSNSNKSTASITSISELQSANGAQTGGAQAHLYRPLLKTSTSILESFMQKSRPRTNATEQLSNSSKEVEFGKNVGSLITDIIFLCPARSLAKTLSEAGRNVYFYLYAHRSSLSQYHDWLGVTHHDEVEFLFGRPLRLADVYSGKDIEMSQRLISIWSHFAYTGRTPDQLGVKWPKYGSEDNNYMTLAAGEASVGERYHDRVCNVYENVILVHLQDG